MILTSICYDCTTGDVLAVRHEKHSWSSIERGEGTNMRICILQVEDVDHDYIEKNSASGYHVDNLASPNFIIKD
jgi:hypothetical protein